MINGNQFKMLGQGKGQTLRKSMGQNNEFCLRRQERPRKVTFVLELEGLVGVSLWPEGRAWAKVGSHERVVAPHLYFSSLQMVSY